MKNLLHRKALREVRAAPTALSRFAGLLTLPEVRAGRSGPLARRFGRSSPGRAKALQSRGPKAPHSGERKGPDLSYAPPYEGGEGAQLDEDCRRYPKPFGQGPNLPNI